MGDTRIRRYVAELIGTFLLVFAGPGAVVIDAVSGGKVGSLGISLSFGLAVMAAVFALGHISGAHINPAVTLGFALTRRFPWAEVPGYLAAQLLGAAAASVLLRALFGETAELGVTLPSGGAGQAFALEVVITFFLMFVITAVATDSRAAGHVAAIAIGGYIALAATFSGPIAGASMNPARSLGPALVHGVWSDQWLYVAGPILGAALGALAYGYVRLASPPAVAPAPAAESAAEVPGAAVGMD